MGETFGVNTDGMIPAVSSLNDAVVRIKGVFDQAMAQLPSKGSTLGDPGEPIADEINKNFLPLVDQVMDSGSGTTTMIGGTADRLYALVVGLDAVERANADSIRLSGSGHGDVLP